MINDYLVFSLKSLRNRKLRSWLTMIGIFIGIAAVVSLIGLGEGLRFAITSQFGFLGADVLSVQASGLAIAGPPGSGVVEPLTDDLAEKISKVNGIEAAFERYIDSAEVEFNDIQIIGFIGSIPSGENRQILEKMINLKTEEGRLLRDGDSKKVLLGANFLDDDIFGKSIKSGDRILIAGKTFTVIGILEKKGNFLLDGGIFLNEDEMFNSLDTDENEVDVIAVKVKNQENIDDNKEDIEKLLRKERDVDEGEENFSVESPQNTLEALNSTLFAIQLFIYIIAGISLAVGGIGIMNTMYTAVLERRKEIGIMKSIGAKNSTIFTLFFIESGFLGSVGGLVGVILGLIFAYGLAFVGQLTLGSDLIQAQVSIFLIIGALAFSFIIGTGFGVLPAYQASKMVPVESLRSAK